MINLKSKVKSKRLLPENENIGVVYATVPSKEYVGYRMLHFGNDFISWYRLYPNFITKPIYFVRFDKPLLVITDSDRRFESQAFPEDDLEEVI